MRIRAALVAAALAICGTANAETLQIPADERAMESDVPYDAAPADEGNMEEAPAAPDEAPQASGTDAETPSLPLRGMSMQAVESRFGAPLEKLAPVGEPPITRWVYADYTVYFEGRYVIHTVPARP
ncbi:MAG: hypothetical protein AB7U81_01695 [Thiohalomonadaceae bacterium]